jgi:hypothetical protein
LPQEPLTWRRSRHKERFVGYHRNGYRANGLRGERVGVRHVDVQVGELSLEATCDDVCGGNDSDSTMFDERGAIARNGELV